MFGSGLHRGCGWQRPWLVWPSPFRLLNSTSNPELPGPILGRFCRESNANGPKSDPELPGRRPEQFATGFWSPHDIQNRSKPGPGSPVRRHLNLRFGQVFCSKLSQALSKTHSRKIRSNVLPVRYGDILTLGCSVALSAPGFRGRFSDRFLPGV